MGVLINTLYSAGEDCQPGTSSYTSRVNEKIVSPGKDDSDSNSCSEEIALSMENSPSEEITSVPSQGKIEPEDESDLLNNQYPTDCNYILSLFDRLNVDWLFTAYYLLVYIFTFNIEMYNWLERMFW